MGKEGGVRGRAGLAPALVPALPFLEQTKD
jgi:hypothetical protein